MVYGYVTTKARYERQMFVVVGLFFRGEGEQVLSRFHHHHHIFVYLEVDKRNSYKLYKYTNKRNRKMVND